MRVALKSYPKYKMSRLKWLGIVPEHWEENRAKYYFREVDERSTTGEEELLSVSHLTGVTPRSEKNVTMFHAESYAGHKLCQPGDLVINTMWAWMAALGVARQIGIVSPSYAVYRARGESGFMPDYLDALLRTQPYAAEYCCRSTGIQTSRLRLYPEEFLDIPIVCPPQKEQEAIAAYLNQKASEIRRLIRNKQKLISLLNERKQAIIRRAVTRGLDPNVRLKPSGIEWLGDVPTHWEVRKLKHIAAMKSGDNLTSIEIAESGEYPVYGGNGLRGYYQKYNKDGKYLLVGRQGALCGNVHRVDRKFWATEHAIVTSVRSGTFLDWCYYMLTVMNLNQYSESAAQPGLSVENIQNLRTALPQYEEQQAIVSHIEKETATIAYTISRAHREIDLIREYRTRMIADVVTGKLDVRNYHHAVAGHRRANTHFYRSVLAAEIVERHQNTPKFGYIKLQKALILAERHLELEEIKSEPLRAAAGPFDNAMMRSVHVQLEKLKWFKAVKTGKGTRYEPMEKCGGHQKYFDKYWGQRREEFDQLMGLILRMSTEQAEIVATLYMAWNDFLIRGEAIDDDKLVNEVLHHWDESKQRIPEDRWRVAINWMRAKGLVPKGFGTPTAMRLGVGPDGNTN